jgi:hypothetical protein
MRGTVLFYYGAYTLANNSKKNKKREFLKKLAQIDFYENE